MKLSKPISIWTALCVLAAALTLTGCWKDALSASKDLKFSAAYVGTKAVYGLDDNGYQQILWQGTDDVRISSDNAVTLLGRHFADYDVTPMNGDVTATQGTISRKSTVIGGNEDSGLRWIDGASGTASFWSVYPASAMADNQLQSISATIPSSTTLQLAVKQPSGSVVKILDPVNGSYPMVAYISDINANSSLVKLSYYPAFTAFQITLTNDTENTITINNCSLHSTTDDLCGSFTAPIADLAQATAVTTSVVATNTDNTVTTGINQVLQSGEGVTFSIFCLPTQLTNLTLSCNYSDNEGTQTKSLALKQNDAYISFAACKQHRINLGFSNGAMEVEITPVIAVVLANAFEDLYDVNGAGELVDKDGNPVDPQEIYQQILNVREVVITEDHGVSLVNYVSGMYAFVNLESLTIDNSVSGQASSINTVNIEGLQHFQSLDIVSAPAIQHVSVVDCPLTETVSIESRSLQTVTLENLSILREIHVGEDQANSNLHTFTLVNCPDLEIAHFGQIGALQNLDVSDCSKLNTLEIELAYQLTNLNLSGCSSLTSLYINKAQSLPDLDVSDCTALETIEIRDAQKLQRLIVHDKPHLRSIVIDSQSPAIEIAELVNLPVLTELVFPTRAVLRYTMTNCDSLTEVNWSNSTSLSTLELSDNDALETISFADATKLSSFTLSSNVLKTLRFNGNQGAPELTTFTLNTPALTTLQILKASSLNTVSLDLPALTTLQLPNTESLATLSLNTPSLTTLELTNTHKLETVSLTNLPSAINDISVFVPTNYNATRNVSLTNCSGFTNIEMNPASTLQEMHFNSCANLRSVTLRSCWNNTNVWNNPPTTNIVATKSNCPNLNSYYTVINGSNTVQFNFN